MSAAMVSPISRGRRSKITASHEVELITPKRAAELLTLNLKNRNLRRSVVDRYARDMVSGRWMFDGSPIRISVDGVLIDGQHRLTAIIESGVTLPMMVIYDLPGDVRDSIDTGAKRSAGDVLQFNGFPDGSAIAATVRIVMAREADHTSLSAGQFSNASIHQWVNTHPEILESAEVYRRAYRSTPGSPSVIAAAHFMCAARDQEAARDFFVTRLIETLGLTADDPVRALRVRLAQVLGRDSYAVKAEQLRYIILAWNIDRDGRKVSKLQAPKGGWTKSNFPEPK